MLVRVWPVSSAGLYQQLPSQWLPARGSASNCGYLLLVKSGPEIPVAPQPALLPRSLTRIPFICRARRRSGRGFRKTQVFIFQKLTEAWMDSHISAQTLACSAGDRQARGSLSCGNMQWQAWSPGFSTKQCTHTQSVHTQSVRPYENLEPEV